MKGGKQERKSCVLFCQCLELRDFTKENWEQAYIRLNPGGNVVDTASKSQLVAQSQRADAF